MCLISDPDRKPLKLPDGNCLACKVQPGKHKYGIRVCEDCDQRLFIKPYGGRDVDEPISSLSLRADHTNTPYRKIEVYYRFSQGDTLVAVEELIDNGRRIQSSPLVVLPGIQPMTEKWIADLPARLPLWTVLYDNGYSSRKKR